ncbi:MAG TPA: 16S rRNA (cytosine(1402)-N(4))-methyltransferase RsmH [Candidatus Saccharimonadales bacterium]|nr:16S rRNA (cytosine(1402)-N(4))-methyltransferase RsmH [Candidatus Saccharimonadales bacterium]
MHKSPNKNQHQSNLHQPVLLDEVLDCLAPAKGERYLDLTAGYGGHAAAILEYTHGAAVLVDRDENAIRELTSRLPGADIRHDDFYSASQQLAVEKQHFDMILADLGVSSPHLNEATRGFAINQEGPLDMRMDPRQELTAETVVNTYGEADLADILWRYGEEPKARQIARAIVANRPLATTSQLAAIVAKAWPGRSRVHPATRTFQALRIAVNDELGLLERSLPIWTSLLASGGRLAVISFHSLEDGIVKRFLQERAGDRYDAELRLITKRPVTASPHELVSNPRARSAKLRAAAKINIQKERER